MRKQGGGRRRRIGEVGRRRRILRKGKHATKKAKEKNEMNDNIDNLIYSFNNNSITVNNWISLRSFINKILSSYPG